MSEKKQKPSKEGMRSKQHGRGPRSGFGGGPPGMGAPAEKAKNFKGTLARLVRYMAPFKLQLVFVGVAAVLSSIFNILSPKILGNATTEMFRSVMARVTGQPNAEMNFGLIGNIMITLLILYVISAAFQYFMQVVMAKVTQKIVYRLREEIESKFARLTLKYFDSKTHGEIMSRVTNDVDNVSNSLQQSVTQIVTSVVTLVSIIIMMLTISPLLTLITFFIMPLAFGFSILIITRSQKYFEAQQKEIGELNGHIEEMYTGHVVVKAFSAEKKNIEEFEAINNRLYGSAWKANFVSGIMFPIMNFISNLGYVAVCVVGGIFVTNGRISIGDIQAFIQYVRQFTQPITQTANIANILQSTIASAERVFELLDEEEELPDAESAVTLTDAVGDIQFKDVAFSYSKDTKLIENLHISAKKGNTIAIVGPTGAGKTTIVNLLMRFYEVDAGEISIDGRNIVEIKRGNYRKVFGMVLQDTWLFSGTIKENITFGKLDATDEEIMAASKMAHSDRFIRSLPEGYETVLSEDATNISQGQKQLLTIARAILADPKILILDEATSSVDTMTEQRIQRGMHNLMKGRTSFVIAHRLSTIQDADLILVMDNGSIIETGTHQALLDANGFYARLYHSQFAEKEVV